MKNETKDAELEQLKDYARRQENQRETYYKEYLKKDKALEEIENFTKKHCDYWCEHHKILDIINKAKDGNNE